MYRRNEKPSGHIPECPFSIEELQSRSKYNAKFSTLRNLQAKADCGIDCASLETYRALEAANSKVRFSKFVSARFSRSLTDLVEVQNFHRQIKYKINKFLFRKKPSNLSLFFIIEPDDLLFKGMTSYHFHYLITHPIDCASRLATMPSALALTYDKKDRLIRQDELLVMSDNTIRRDDQRLITDPFEILLFKKTRRTQIHTANNEISISSVKIEDIYDQKCLSDYLMKKLKRSPKELMIDYLNSYDLDFTVP